MTTLTTDHIDPMALLERADLAPGTFDKYSRALTRYQETGRSLFDAQALADYADTISDTEKRYLSAVVTRVSKEADTFVEAVPANTVEQVSAKQERLMQNAALRKVVKAPEPKGDKTHIWLSPQQVKALANEIQNGIVGARDRVAIGLLVSAGLRRQEAVSLRWDDIKQQPYGDKVRTVLAVTRSVGKGGKARTVPISDTLARDLDKWSEYTGRDGLVLRSLGMNKEPGQSLSDVALFKLVRKYAARVDTIPGDLAPHDLRRTYGELGRQAGVDIAQLSLLLGHSSIETTMRYFNIGLDIETTASDFVPW